MNPSAFDPVSVDLPAARAEAWRLLTTAVVDRAAAMHVVSLASSGLDGRPRARMVVLRKADPEGWRVRAHADLRGEKIAELQVDPRIAILAYDAGARTQIRLEGVARILAGDDVARIAWTASGERSRATYRVDPRPGERIIEGGAYRQGAADDEPDAGFRNFAVIDIAVARLEWLLLADTGHRRARFDRDGGMAWLTP